MFRIARTGLFAADRAGSGTTAGNGQGNDVAENGGDAGQVMWPRHLAGVHRRSPAQMTCVATVTSHNHTSKITKGEVFGFFSRYPLPPTEDRDEAYHVVIDNLVNPILLNEFLRLGYEHPGIVG